MKTKLVLVASYFIFTPFFLLALIAYQQYLHHQDSSVSGKSVSLKSTELNYRALPQRPSETKITLIPIEARIEVLKEFLGRYDSPLLSYAKDIVEAADKYDLDWRLLPAIAMQESTLCKKMPKESYNCWGFGIYGKKVTKFADFNEAIDTVSKTLAKEYHGQGLLNPAEIMTKYTPSNQGIWAENVSYVMDRIAARLDSQL